MGRWEDAVQRQKVSDAAARLAAEQRERQKLVDQLYGLSAKFARKLAMISDPKRLPAYHHLLRIDGVDHLGWTIISEGEYEESLLEVTVDGWLIAWARSFGAIGDLRTSMDRWEQTASDRTHPPGYLQVADLRRAIWRVTDLIKRTRLFF